MTREYISEMYLKYGKEANRCFKMAYKYRAEGVDVQAALNYLRAHNPEAWTGTATVLSQTRLRAMPSLGLEIRKVPQKFSWLSGRYGNGAVNFKFRQEQHGLATCRRKWSTQRGF